MQLNAIGKAPDPGQRLLSKKIFHMIRITAFLLFAGCMQLSARGWAQHITLRENKASLEKVIRDIQKQSNYAFFYDRQLLSNSSPVTLNLTEEPLTEVLQKIFKSQPLTYEIIGDKIITLKEKDIVRGAGTNPQFLQADTIRTLHGTVTDDKGEPVIGASIRVKGTGMGTVTDAQGTYTLQAPENAVLEVSSLGYENKEVAISGLSLINIMLSSSTTGLNQLVVVGYGTQKKSDLTAAISTLDMSSRAGQPITNASNALYGVPGLYVNLIQSMPGTDRAQIRVRGISNLNSTGSDPLVLVDGIEYPMDEINPDDIATISVLKDAAASIYGSKAANGVILVTTKKGRGEAKVNYNYYYGVQQPTYMPDVIWDPIEYMKLFDQAELNEGKQTVSFSPQQIQEYEVGMHVDPYTYPANDWFDMMMKNGTIQKHNISVSKSTETYSYRASLGFLNREGIFIGPGNKEQKYSIGLNSSLKISDRLSMGLSINGNYRYYTEPSYTTGTFLNALMRALPIMPDTLRDGSYGYTWLRVPGRNNWENPRMYAYEGSYKKVVQRFLTTMNADYRLPWGLSYHAKFGVDKYDGLLTRFVPKMIKLQAKTQQVQVHSSTAPESYSYDDNNIDIHFYNTLNWEGTFPGGHSLTAMAGASYDNYAVTYFNAQMRGYSDNTLDALDAGSDPYAIAGRATRDVLESYFGRVNYNYKDKYLVQGIFRFDGSARFAPGHRWGFFPSVSAGWRIDKEPFFKGLRFMDLLKLRASVGQLGNQAVALYSYDNDVTLGHYYSFGGANGQLFSGAASTALADPTTSWETTTDYDLGIDADFWGDRISLTVDLYKKWTTGLLRTVDIPDQVGGLSGPKKNVGTISNTGYEVGIKYRNHIRDFTYSIYGDVSYNSNRVEDLNGEIIYNNSNSGLSTITQKGSVVSAFYLLQAEGIFQSDEDVADHATQSGNTKAGYIKYKDVNGDGKINEDDRVRLDVSAVTPKYNYGFGFNVGYKGIGLSAYFQGVGGYWVMPAANLAFPFNNGAGATWEWATDSWTPQNTDAKLPIITEANYGDKENFKPSTFWLKNASYLRLKNIQLDYRLPESWLSKINVAAVSIFINAENWLTFTHFTESDPEGIYNATTLYHYPMLKTVNGGINVTF